MLHLYMASCHLVILCYHSAVSRDALFCVSTDGSSRLAAIRLVSALFGGAMPKIGRNDPCPCGSGKKYKQCHLPIEEAAAAEQLRLRRSVDILLPKIINAAQAQVGAIPAAFDRFWDSKYTPEQLEELDDLEGRGGERFLTWFAFDYPLDDGRTLVEQLAA